MKMIANRKCHTYASPQRTFTLFAGFNAKRTKRPFMYKKNTTKMKQTDGNNNDVSFQVCEFIWECT